MCSLFQDDDGNDSTQAIIEAINNGIRHLSEQIYRFHKDVMEQFSEVHKKLNIHHKAMLEQFFAMRQGQVNIIEQLRSLRQYIETHNRAIMGSMDALHKTIDSNFKMTFDNLNGLRIEDIDDLIDRSLIVLKSEKVSSEKFASIVEDLYIKATSRASADALTGGSVDVRSESTLQRVLESSSGQQTIFAHPAFSNINLLSRYMESKSIDFRHEKLVNPLIWIKCVEAILCLIDQRLTKYSDYPADEDARDSDIDKLLALKQEGEKILNFIEGMSQGRFLSNIATEYQKSLRHLAKAIKKAKKQYEENSAKELCSDYREFIESEKSKAGRILASYDCKKCMEYVASSLDVAKKAQNYNNMGRGRLVSTYFRDQPADVGYEGSKWITIDDFPKSSDRFKKFFEQYQNEINEKKNQLNRIKVDLAQSEFTPIRHGKSIWLYPEQDENLPILTMPDQILNNIEPTYIVAENKGLGTITYNYYITERDFHIVSYFTLKEDEAKIKILHLFKYHGFDKDMYSYAENILHFWYGGRYPRKTDTYVTAPVMLGGMLGGSWRPNINFSGHLSS